MTSLKKFYTKKATCWSGFFEAASNFRDEPEALQELIQNAPDLDLTDGDGLTLLHYAAREGHFEAVRMLVKEGVRLEMQDRDGRTPLHLACIYANYPQRVSGNQHVEIAKYLQYENANTSAQDKYNRVPLAYLPQEAKRYGVVSSVALNHPVEFDPRAVWAVEQVVPGHRSSLGSGGGVLDGSVAQASDIHLLR